MMIRVVLLVCLILLCWLLKTFLKVRGSVIKAIKRTDDYSSILDSVLNKIVAYTVFNESGGNEKITPQTYSALEKRHPFNKISFIMDNAFLHILSNREKLVSSDYLAQFLTSLTNVNLILKDVFGLENKPFMEIKFLDFDSNTTEDFALAKISTTLTNK